MKVRSRANSVMSGASTPGGGRSKSLSEGDLRKADAALSNVNEAQSATNGVNGGNGHYKNGKMYNDEDVTTRIRLTISLTS